MTMDAQRRADVLVYLRDILAGCEGGWARVRTDPAMWPAAIRDAVSALEAPKSSVDSLVERVRALEDFVREVRSAQALTIITSDDGASGTVSNTLVYLKTRAAELLDGPPDPERDRESRSEVERPDVSTEEVER